MYFSFYTKYQDVIQSVNSWEKFNVSLYYQVRFTDQTIQWIYPNNFSVVGTNLNWTRQILKVTLDGEGTGKVVEELLDIRIKVWLENATGQAYISNLQLEEGDFATAWKPHAEDGEYYAISYAESEISQLADQIALKVSKDGLISEINIQPEGVKIQANKINLVGAVTADTISSLKGLDVGNGQFVVDGVTGDVSFGGDIKWSDRLIQWRLL